MQRLSTTVVALVGPGSAAGLQLLDSAANVRVVHPDEGPPLDRAVAAWREASGTHLPFFVHDADPLAAVGAAAELRRLPAGRWWPPLEEVVVAVDAAVPDVVTLDVPTPGSAAPKVSGLVSPGGVRAVRHR